MDKLFVSGYSSHTAFTFSSGLRLDCTELSGWALNISLTIGKLIYFMLYNTDTQLSLLFKVI